ncbi:MAG: glycosyltransferase family 1 protein [Campylobacterales bacterium]|nr:glycosyltransferase family 1 protein [Campylobacterales bacterium]
MKNIKVLLFTDTLCDVNGVSRFIQDISRIASQKGLALYVVTSTVKSCPDLPNVQIIKPSFRTRMPFYRDLDLVIPSYRKLKSITEEIDPDVVHISTPGFVGLMGRRIARKRSIPMVGTYHTDFPAFAYKNMPCRIVKYIGNRVMQWFYRDFKALFVRSEAYQKIVREDVRFDPEKIHTLKAGIDTRKFHAGYRDMGIWQEYGIPERSLKALYVGRFTKEKNFPLLLELWKAYYTQSKNKNIYLITVGGNLDDSLFERYHIRSLGIKKGEELSKIYASSDLFLFPSTTDTLGQVVMEAMSSGLPVIVSDIGGPQTLIGKEREAGYALDVKERALWLEKIKVLMEDEVLRKELGGKGHQIIARMDIEKSFEVFWKEHVQQSGGR